jgi:DNA-binding GntR family transcriptional regulator
VAEQLKPIRVNEVFAQIKARILRWEYPPGHRFTEEELCREFGVSRSPIRETMRMLEEQGLVDKIPYRGCRVKQPDLAEINELYDVRLILELAAVERLAARRPIPNMVLELRQTWQRLALVQAHSAIDSAELATLDRVFHETITVAAGNQTLADMLVGVNERLHFIRMTDITTVDRLWQTCQQHLAVLDALEQGHSAQAQAAMQANIEGARSQVRDAIKEVLARAYMANAL